MKVLVLSNGIFEEKEINNTLEALQKEVGGYIEIPFLSEKLYNKRIDMIINEEGKMIDGLKIEVIIGGRSDGLVKDIILGNVVFASNDDEGNTIGLTEKQIEFIKQELNQTIFVGGHTIRMLWI